MAKTAPYGSWPSPITADSIVQKASIVDDVFVDPVTSKIYHIETRPAEGGRNVLVKTEEGTELFGQEWNCRSGVHEMGGAAAIAYNGKIYFSNFSDSRVYAINGDGKNPEPITPESKTLRYAVFAAHPRYQHFIVAVQEDHTNPAPADVVNTLCLIDTQHKRVITIASGADFYTSPCFSPDGSYIAWQQWNHPDMSWEGGEIWVAKIKADEAELRLIDARHVAGRPGAVSTGYPAWVSSDALLFTSDESGYQNPWMYTLSTGQAKAALETPVAEDFSQPAWMLGGSYGAQIDIEGKMALFTALRDGRSVLYVVSLHCGTFKEIECPYAVVRSVRPVVDGAVVFIGTKVDAAGKIVLCTLKDYSKPHFKLILKAKSDAPVKQPIPESYISKPEPLTLEVPPSDDPLYVVLYLPSNPDFKGPQGEKPPCIVSAHGGPTAFADQGFDITKQYFTSRGFAWLDVNYGGSSGYGRKYTDRLRGQWGVVDVRDSALAVSALAKQHALIDPARTAIRGRSSGGFTALAAVSDYPTVFAAATSHYGISDLVKLDEFTHKFESRYCERLLGGTPKDVPKVYHDRSPVHKADKIKAPLLILQGAIDVVVPPEQAEDIVKTIKEKGGKVKYVLFDGEGHGFRKAENIKAALEHELAFYQDVLGLKQ